MNGTRRVYTSESEIVALGRELGRGGEGVVYELPASPAFVAKLYHSPPDASKQQKLRLMADSIDSPLRNYAAWPEETLHDASGAVIGFTMQRIEKRSPIHMLYSPAQRRESFPNARFDFLVFVARNIAAAFETLHAHGHVLGDVNQGNVLVGEDSRVILIDCDSFQIHVGDALHRCEVGVAHFTPPELQSVSSFEDITRTPNHDGFGLALLIFHLLMGGRHPYSGVPLADKVGESLEADIRDFRYAYAKDAATRLMSPPPKSVPIDSLPPAIIDLFQRAFVESGIASRPTPQQWVAALDALRAQLKACAKHPLHMHSKHQVECVWCVLERKRVLFFGQLPKASARPEAAFAPTALSLSEMEDLVAKMPVPQRLEGPSLPELRAANNAALEQQQTDGTVAAVLGLLVVGGALTPFNPMLGVAVAGGAVAVGGIFGARSVWVSSAKRGYEEATGRYKRLRDRYSELAEEINDACGLSAHDQWRSASKALRQHVAKGAHALAEFKLEVAERNLRLFLQGKRIDQWKDPRLSQLERVRLRSAGIETATDFDKASLGKLRVLSEGGRAAVLQWKLDLVHEFNKLQARQAPNLQSFQQQRDEKRRQLETQVAAAFADLQTALKHGSLVLAARKNQLASLKAEMHKQYKVCVELAEQLP